MRKADYAALADIIRHHLTFAKAYADAPASKEKQDYEKGRADALEQVARGFTNRASVDRAAFLKACGIE